MFPAEPKRCPSCGYILEHLPEPRCPECGREFDLRWPESYVVGQAPRPGNLHFFFAVFGAAILGFAGALYHANTRLGWPVIILALLSVSAEVYIALRSRNELKKPPCELPRRTYWQLALAVSLLVLVGSCGSGLATCYAPSFWGMFGCSFTG